MASSTHTSRATAGPSAGSLWSAARSLRARETPATAWRLVVDAPSLRGGEARTEPCRAAGFGSLKARVGDARCVGDVTLGTADFASRSEGDVTFATVDTGDRSAAHALRQNGRVGSVGAIGRVAWERPWGTPGATALAEAREQGLPGTIQRPNAFASLATSRLLGAADARLSHTLLHPANVGDDPLVRGRPLPGRPLHALALGRTMYVDSPLTGRAVGLPLSDVLGFPLPGRAVSATARLASE